MKSVVRWILPLLGSCFVLPACSGGGGGDGGGFGAGSDGPGITVNPNQHDSGDPVAGREVFRFETFGNEGFWTDAVRLPQGVVAANLTPIQVLSLGLVIDAVAVPENLLAPIQVELATDLTPENAPLLNSASTTVALLDANAIVGLVAKDTTGDGTIDVLAGDKVGVSCALCHTVSDESMFVMHDAGSIGRRLDGRANHVLNFGVITALAENTRALYPLLQLALDAHDGATVGRAAAGLTEASTEAEVDAYLANPDFYPCGMFDDTPDAIGNPAHFSPLFRTDLAAPWGTDGSIRRLDNFSNHVYTALLDPTSLTTRDGRDFLVRLNGAVAGDEIVDDYLAILKATNVTGYPFVTAELHPVPGSEDAFVGVRVDETKLVDLNGYLDSLAAPQGADADPAAIARGLALFRESCTACHNRDQSLFVPPFVVPMATIWPGDDPDTLLGRRQPPLNSILNSPGLFDDQMAVMNASIRGLARGAAMPLLLDLARKPTYLHDNSIATLDELLHPSRGRSAPHPFYLRTASQRADMSDFLRSLDTDG